MTAYSILVFFLQQQYTGLTGQKSLAVAVCVEYSRSSLDTRDNEKQFTSIASLSMICSSVPKK